MECLTRDPVPLAEVPTRLERMPRVTQDRLMNWGYAICDAAMRAHMDQRLPPGRFPYPAAGVGA